MSGEFLGALMVIDTDSSVIDVERAAVAAAAAGHAGRERAVLALLGPDPVAREAAAGDLRAAGVLLPERVAVVVVEAGAPIGAAPAEVALVGGYDGSDV